LLKMKTFYVEVTFIPKLFFAQVIKYNYMGYFIF